MGFVYQSSSTYWEGKSDMETLQRIYGISFPDNKMMKEWEKVQEEAKNRDHRKIGKVHYSTVYFFYTSVTELILFPRILVFWFWFDFLLLFFDSFKGCQFCVLLDVTF